MFFSVEFIIAQTVNVVFWPRNISYYLQQGFKNKLREFPAYTLIRNYKIKENIVFAQI